MAEDSPHPSPARWPSFYDNEIVRLVDLSIAPTEMQKLLGEEGTVMARCPDPENRGLWVTGVWLPAVGKGIDFWEEQLGPTGLTEVYDDEGGFEGIGGHRVSRVPLTPEEPSEYWGSEVSVELYVPATEEPLEDIAARAEAALRELTRLNRVSWRGERYWKDPQLWNLVLDLWPTDSGREAFERIVAEHHDWFEQEDNGWDARFSWWHESTEGGEECFILPEAWGIVVIRLPWSDPIYRPIPAGRKPPSMPRINQRPEPDE